MTTFDSAQRFINPNFGKGINTRLSRTERSALDRAWRTGFVAGQEDGNRAMPPASFSDAEVGAFMAGIDAAVWGDWDNGQLEAAAEMAEMQELHERGYRVF